MKRIPALNMYNYIMIRVRRLKSSNVYLLYDDNFTVIAVAACTDIGDQMVEISYHQFMVRTTITIQGNSIPIL